MLIDNLCNFGIRKLFSTSLVCFQLGLAHSIRFSVLIV